MTDFFTVSIGAFLWVVDFARWSYGLSSVATVSRDYSATSVTMYGLQKNLSASLGTTSVSKSSTRLSYRSYALDSR